MPRNTRDEAEQVKWQIDPKAQKWEVHGLGWSSLFNSKSKRLPDSKGWHPEDLGPGKYIGHSQYSHTQLVGPFLAKVERFQARGAPVGETPQILAKRGPGLYVGLDIWNDGVRQAAAPFGHNSERETIDKAKINKVAKNLGPGTYIGHEDYKVQTSTVGFGSRAERFAPPPRSVRNGTERGPGKYVGHQVWECKPLPVGFGEAQRRFTQLADTKLKLQAPEKDVKGNTKLDPNMGPGRYLGHETYRCYENKEAFQCATPRFREAEKPRTSPALGPGSYLGHKSYG